MVYPGQFRQSVVALGNFDGLHLGHRRLIARAVSIARQTDAIPTVWCFATHPAVFLGKPHPGLLMQAHRKSEQMRVLGVEQEIQADFVTTRDLSPEEFVDSILIDRLNASHVVCGFNYSFGKNAKGTCETLRTLLSRRGVALTVEAPVTFEGEVISSSRIRRLLQEGRISRANAMLGCPLALEAKVEAGKQLGRSLGFPTANQSLPADFATLRRGVYASVVKANGVAYPSVTNVGVRPTVEGNGALNCESYLLGFSGNLYGQTVTCEFWHFLREERRFDSVDALKQQVNEDIGEVECYFESIR